MEGLWLSPGQPERQMLLCCEFASQCLRLAICWDFKVGEEKVTHGSWGFIEIENDVDFIILHFHCSNKNCYKLVTKTLYAKGFGIWRDVSCKEILLIKGVAQPTNPIQRNSANMKFDDEQLLNEIGHEHFTKRADAIYPKDYDFFIKFALRWMHPEKQIEYVLLLANHTIVFVNANKEVSPVNGYWTYDETCGFVTHFHCKGLKNPKDEPAAPMTILKHLNMDVTEVDHALPMETFIVGGEEHEEDPAASVGKRLKMFDESELYKAKRWHIVAQKVWP